MSVSRFGRLALLSVVVFGSEAFQAQASLIETLGVSVTKTGSAYTFDYTLTNSQSSTVGVSVLFLTVGGNSSLFSLSAPTGWDTFYNPGDTTLEFSSSLATTDIAPGTFGTFSVSSLVGPRNADYLARGFDDQSATFFDSPGTVATPSAVPEPSTIVLAGIGAVGLMVWGRREQSKR